MPLLFSIGIGSLGEKKLILLTGLKETLKPKRQRIPQPLSVECEISMSKSISSEIIMHFSNWSKNCLFCQYSMHFFIFYTLSIFYLLKMCGIVHTPVYLTYCGNFIISQSSAFLVNLHFHA